MSFALRTLDREQSTLLGIGHDLEDVQKWGDFEPAAIGHSVIVEGAGILLYVTGSRVRA